MWFRGQLGRRKSIPNVPVLRAQNRRGNFRETACHFEIQSDHTGKLEIFNAGKLCRTDNRLQHNAELRISSMKINGILIKFGENHF
jgi:hypothetical protein